MRITTRSAGTMPAARSRPRSRSCPDIPPSTRAPGTGWATCARSRASTMRRRAASPGRSIWTRRMRRPGTITAPRCSGSARCSPRSRLTGARSQRIRTCRSRCTTSATSTRARAITRAPPSASARRCSGIPATRPSSTCSPQPAARIPSGRRKATSSRCSMRWRPSSTGTCCANSTTGRPRDSQRWFGPRWSLPPGTADLRRSSTWAAAPAWSGPRSPVRARRSSAWTCRRACWRSRPDAASIRAWSEANSSTFSRVAAASVLAILAADVFIYVGNLDAVFDAVSAALAPGGVFGLSVEATGDKAGYRLKPTGRYAHSLDYLYALAAKAGLEKRRLQRCRIRREGRGYAEGWLALFAKIRPTGLADHEQDDADQDQHRQLVEPAVPDVAVPVALMPEIQHQLAAPEVVGDQRRDQRELGVQPDARAAEPAEPEPQAEADREHAARRRDAPEELALHDLEALDRRPVLRLRVIDEQARQVEQTREPGHHEHDVQRLDDRQRHRQLFCTIARRMASRRWKKWSAPGTTSTGSSCGRAQSSTAASGIVVVGLAVNHQRVRPAPAAPPECVTASADQHHALARHAARASLAAPPRRTKNRRAPVARRCACASTAARSSTSPRPSSCRPSLAPTPRKFGRQAA